MKIIFNNQIYEIDEDLLKLSESLKWISEGKEREDEPIPLQKCDNEIFEIFMKWFNKLKKEGIKILIKKLKCSLFVFKTELFIDYDFNILRKLLEFGFVNQIELLFNTIAYVIYKLGFDYSKLSDVYKNIINIFKSKYAYEYNAALVHILNIKGISVLELNDENYCEYVEKLDSEDSDDESYDEEETENKTENEKNCEFDVVFTHYEYLGKINTYFIVASNDCIGLRPKVFHFVPLGSPNCIKCFYYITKDGGCCFDERCLRFLNKFFPNFSYGNSIAENIEEYLKFMFGKNDYMWLLGFENLDDTIIVGNKLVQVKRNTTDFIIDNNIEHICDCCFKNCVDLKNVVIGNKVKTIGEYAFEECKNLSAVAIPNSVKAIGYYAFARCENLSSVNIPNGVKTIGDRCFYRCKALKNITIPGSVKTIGDAVFDHSGLSNVIINNGIKYLSSECFKNCENLISIDIPESVKMLDGLCFAECENLISVNVPKGIKINCACFRESDNVKINYY